eukprot:Gb_19124 [translate_table: standard]
MADEKSLGLDDLPCEFYKAMWDFIGTPLLNVYKEAITKGSLGEIINRGDIRFIPKAGDPKLISSWRPITLLNVSYKILTKSIAKRVKHFLPWIVRLEQTSIIKGRYT